MTQMSPTRQGARPAPAGERTGYVIAIVANAIMLYIANNVLAWDVLPFLTDDFTRVLPLLNVSLAAAMLVNAVYIGYDARWFKSSSQIVLLAISLAVTVRLYRVFPFDFAAAGFDWELLLRFVLMVAMFGIGVGIVVELGRLIFGTAQDDDGP